MTPNNLSFKSENLVVDWISFNAKGLIDSQPIARYLLQFGFNSFQFPNFFVKYRNKYHFEVKLEIIRVFSTDNTEKIFQTETFLKQF